MLNDKEIPAIPFSVRNSNIWFYRQNPTLQNTFFKAAIIDK